MTDDCLDKRFERMIHHYELGLLSEKDRPAFELHLFDCEACYNKVEQFAETAHLIRHDPEVRAGIRRLAEESAEEAPAAAPEEEAIRPRRVWSRVIPVVAVAAALLVLLLRPWHVEIQPTREAVARQNRLAILDFTDLSGDSVGTWIGSVSTNLLITDLSESQFVQVVSRQRLLDIRRRVHGPESAAGPLDESAALQVAREADARWLLTGVVIQVKPEIVLSVQLVDVSSGDAVTGRRVYGETAQGIFPLIDKLSHELRNDLALPEAARQEPDPQVADLTTHSAEAYSHYLEGLDLLDRYYRPQAEEQFRRALEFDSTLAMAYYFLSELSDRALIDQAVAHIDRVGQKENFYIRSRKAAYVGDLEGAIAILDEAIARYPDEKEAHFQIGKHHFTAAAYADAARHLNIALQLDPLFKSARNHLVYTYDRMGQYEDAIATINTYISLAPEEPNPYDTRGEIYARHGRYDLAIASFNQALAIEPTFFNSRLNLGYIYNRQGEYDLARAQFDAIVQLTDPRTRAHGRLMLTTIPMRQGRLAQALRELDAQISADEAEQNSAATQYYNGQKHYQKMWCLAELGDWNHALSELKQSAEFVTRVYPDDVAGQRQYQVELLAASGATDQAEAVAQSLRDDLEAAGQRLDAYWYALGTLELARNNPTAAVAALERIDQTMDDLAYQYMLAKASLEAGRLPDAVALLEQLLSRGTYYRAYWTIQNTKMHYLLGRAYEESNWDEKAAAKYEEFLTIWKDADKGIAVVEDAKSRLARLRSGS
ncbi:MAG TPA: tetratricopeptide repeat protein [Acidobacteriota bacterium]|nr:tetratricopeptide repeat protein [Acidobacteriota bacterium]